MLIKNGLQTVASLLLHVDETTKSLILTGRQEGGIMACRSEGSRGL